MSGTETTPTYERYLHDGGPEHVVKVRREDEKRRILIWMRTATLDQIADRIVEERDIAASYAERLAHVAKQRRAEREAADGNG